MADTFDPIELVNEQIAIHCKHCPEPGCQSKVVNLHWPHCYLSPSKLNILMQALAAIKMTDDQEVEFGNYCDTIRRPS